MRLLRAVWIAALLVLSTGWLLAQQGGSICDGSETPCDEARPWMRGTQEKKCARLGDPEEGVLECECRMMCDPESRETQGRRWDSRCAARCNPRNCTCPNPCTS